MKDSKRSWSRGDIFLLALLFYLLGMLTAVIVCVFLLHTNREASWPIHFFTYQEKIGWEEEMKVGPIVQTGSPEQPIDDPAPISPYKHNQLWETTTVLRSALYQFVKANGYMPQSLDVLTHPFPNNYLTAIPKEPLTYSAEISHIFTDQGGWVYQPRVIEDLIDGELQGQIEEALFPNVNEGKNLPFNPISLVLEQDTYTLRVISGDKVLRSYEVGLGRDGRTPEGHFSVAKKMMNPNSHRFPAGQNPYGKRGLELEGGIYAIHGTNNPDSIGNNLSNGCIRLQNQDVVELYSMVPLYTPVEILPEGVKKEWREPFLTADSGQPLYSEKERPEEADPDHFYNWAY